MRIVRCARCGGDHDDVVPQPLDHPMAPPDITPRLVWSKWAPCPTNGQPIMFEVSTYISRDDERNPR